MLLEIKVMGSAEWFEQAIPLLQAKGLVEREDLHWADPETDGEYMGCYFDYGGAVALPFADLANLLVQVEEIIQAGEAPFVRLAIVAYET